MKSYGELESRVGMLNTGRRVFRFYLVRSGEMSFTMSPWGKDLKGVKE